MKKQLIIANWKMNKKYSDIKVFFKTFKGLVKKDRFLNKTIDLLDYMFAPTYMGILPAISISRNKYKILSQDVSQYASGAYTSQVSFEQLKEYNVYGSIIGHSETRQYLNVLDEDVNKKMLVLINNNMIPVLCIGETKTEYDAKKTAAVIKKQLTVAFKDITQNDASKVIVAYEPIWAIGTSLTPTEKEITDCMKMVRDTLTNLYDKVTASKIFTLYGGSAKSKNANKILSLENVDGLLVGGASLDAKDFYDILIQTPAYFNYATKAAQIKQEKKRK